MPPTIEASSAIQRDSLQTFIVDVAFQIFDPSPLGISALVEWSQDPTGPWNPATDQTFDRKHSVPQLLVPINTASPGSLFNFVWNAFFDLPEGTFNDVHVRLTISNTITVTDTVVVIGPISVNTVEEPSDEDVALANQLKRRASISRTPLDFLGNGLTIPFRRGSRDFVSESGVELVRAAVRQILGTRASVGEFVGELIWRQDFGSKLWVLRHRKNDDTLRDQAMTFVREAMLQEPRVQVNDVFVEKEPISASNELQVRVLYQIIIDNVNSNRVILPEEEAVIAV